MERDECGGCLFLLGTGWGGGLFVGGFSSTQVWSGGCWVGPPLATLRLRWCLDVSWGLGILSEELQDLCCLILLDGIILVEEEEGEQMFTFFNWEISRWLMYNRAKPFREITLIHNDSF